jgi:hypothetical protein
MMKITMMKFCFYVPATILVVVLVTMCGCTSEPPKAKVVPVSGTVLLGGKPLENVQVFMEPMRSDGKSVPVSAAGITDAEGKFLLQVAGRVPRQGAMPGANSVTISFDHSRSEDSPVEVTQRAKLPRLPVEWLDGSLIFDVPANGTDQANFAK